MLSPLCLAAATDEIEVIRFLHRFREMDAQRDLDLALFLANRQGHTATGALLLKYKANPAQESSPNGMHGAAWRGLNKQIYDYVLHHGARPNVTDGSSATPVIYAILGVQDEQGAWETIECLFKLGASPWASFGTENLSYADIAQKEGKKDLAQKLEEACPSPTILNSSRESSCTVGGDNVVQPDNKRPREDSEVDGGAKRARGA
jgi:ankyrin repeat protein